MRGIVWFREDLRTIDNKALHHAAKQCDDGVIAIYLLDPAMWKKHDVAACKVNFLLRGLAKLKENLAKLTIHFIVVKIDEGANIPELIRGLLTDCKAQALFFNRQYEYDELSRDQAVQQLLAKNALESFAFDDKVILAPGTIKNLQGQDYQIFTAYKQAWLKHFREQTIKPYPTPKAQKFIEIALKSYPIPEKLPGFETTIDPDLWPIGQEAALRRLHRFVDNSLFQYHEIRDFPAQDGTSKLSPYLAAGMISPRQCFLSALEVNNNEMDSGNQGATTWLTELIWREFYQHILIAAPRVSKHQAYQQNTDKIRWDFNKNQLQAWQEGQTGYPIIDAAMRQLNTTGWMHNRLRMVVAMFLTKNLFFDWRLGEKYFISHLIDGDLAANNGGWQWSASTGTDSAPYFRIFNPVRQSERFDPEGKFILQYCPELKGFDKKSIHDPHTSLPLIAELQGYPYPIVALRSKREKVIAAYKKVSA
ncbi:MAG: deoxyribodipyrimidine photo-lyase [Pseudomonadota bacterium]